jgi:hypothetical protein
VRPGGARLSGNESGAGPQPEPPRRCARDGIPLVRKPALEAPKSKEGDWWLRLPIDFDSSKPPKDDTKAANDLITNDGRRVIQVKGMKISVGAGALTTVGKRPQDVGKDDELAIEHASGARILIKEGEIQLTDGKVTLTIHGGKVDIS